MTIENFRITVFGGSKPMVGEKAYQNALNLGTSLGHAGFTVLTGGYIGTMEAVSRGAAEAGGHVIGITCDEIESWRPVSPNLWIDEEIRYPTLKKRLYALIDNCDAALALPGGVGTLQEIIVMWAQLQIGACNPKPLILVGEGWELTIGAFYRQLGEYIPKKDRQWIHFVPDVTVAIEALQSLISGT
jgi:uncharacterized protein (TIGR00730 family)